MVLTASSDLSIRVFGLDGVNPRTLKGHLRAVTSVAVVGVGKRVVSASKDGTVRMWDVGQGKEVRRWSIAPRTAVEKVVYVTDEVAVSMLRQRGRSRETVTNGHGQAHDDTDGVILAALQSGDIAVIDPSSNGSAPVAVIPSPVESNLVSFAYDPVLQLAATGHTNGVISLRRLADIPTDTSATTQHPARLFRRNESPIYSLAFHYPKDANGERSIDLFVGTAAGLPCRLSIAPSLDVRVKEEFAGWEAAGVECWASSGDSAWCAGGEGGVRRY